MCSTKQAKDITEKYIKMYDEVERQRYKIIVCVCVCMYDKTFVLGFVCVVN